MIFILYPYRISNPVVRHFRRAVTQTWSVISIKGLIANVFNAAILLSQRKAAIRATILFGISHPFARQKETATDSVSTEFVASRSVCAV